MRAEEPGRRSTDGHPDDDWRLQGQAAYLTGVALAWRRYQPPATNPRWDHDHCEFCGDKFMAGDGAGALHEGYSTDDQSHWICGRCFGDFRDTFGWQVTG